MTGALGLAKQADCLYHLIDLSTGTVCGVWMRLLYSPMNYYVTGRQGSIWFLHVWYPGTNRLMYSIESDRHPEAAFAQVQEDHRNRLAFDHHGTW